MSTKPAISAPTFAKGDSSPSPSVSQKSATVRRTFLGAVLTMSWQLAVVVLVPIVGGAQLDKSLHTKSLWTFVGLGVAFVAASLVMWVTVQRVNRLPVPKLTATEKEQVKRSYDAEDED